MAQTDLNDHETWRTLQDVEGQDKKPARAWDPTGGEETRSNRCHNCGAHVDPGMTRVFGGDRLERCPECATGRQLFDGAGAGGRR